MEEAMIRGVMPRTSATDVAPLVPAWSSSPSSTVVASRHGSRLVKPLTVTLKELAHA